tara:strand:+ start:311 stop:1693 length:1383 start_codon:yes stop_codon:yes gene_type:complete
MGLLDGTSQNSYYTKPASYGNYQFVTLKHLIEAFMVTHVGDGKILPRVSRTDVQFHAMRAIQELSYDVFRSIKSQEIEVPSTLKMILPQDYVNYVKLVRVGSDGIERTLMPSRKTSNPFAISQDDAGNYKYNLDKRVVELRMPENGSDGIVDGDYFSLLWPNPDLINPFSALDEKSQLFFIFDKDADPADGAEPSSDEEGIRSYISLGVTTFTKHELADKVKLSIESFGFHTVEKNALGNLTITYKGDLAWSSPDGLQNISPLNSLATSEWTYAANQDDTDANGTNMQMILIDGGGNLSVPDENNNTLMEQTPSNTWSDYGSQESLTDSVDSADVDVDYRGRRYGLDPQYAYQHGSFYIDNLRGMIHFSSTLPGKTIILKYISDGLGTDEEMVVHKFAEEAIYKWIAYGILSCRSGVPDGLLMRFKAEKFTETRKAKIRLSNIKIEEFAQVIRGMGKQIK